MGDVLEANVITTRYVTSGRAPRGACALRQVYRVKLPARCPEVEFFSKAGIVTWMKLVVRQWK